MLVRSIKPIIDAVDSPPSPPMCWTTSLSSTSVTLSALSPGVSSVGMCLSLDCAASDQPHPLQARVAASADDDVVMHGDAERGGDIDDRFRHLDVGLRRRRIAAGVVV